jgi:hypothetical protein
MKKSRKVPDGSRGKFRIVKDGLCHHAPWDQEKTHDESYKCDKHYENSIGIYTRSLFFLRPLKDILKLDKPVADFPGDKTLWPNYFADRNTEILQEELNSHGYRSNSFINKHDGKHVLFLGCSYTWGSGLFIEETWPKIVYNNISNNEKLSGYFNMAYPGDSVFSQVSNAFKYFKNFGNPQVIFFNVPDLNRFYGYSKTSKSIVKILTEQNDNGLISFLAGQYYYMLEQYCNANNIQLFSFSWSYENKEIKNAGIEDSKTFYKINIKDLFHFTKQYKKDHHGEDALELARDNAHLGRSDHAYWAKFITEKYRESQ